MHDAPLWFPQSSFWFPIGICNRPRLQAFSVIGSPYRAFLVHVTCWAGVPNPALRLAYMTGLLKEASDEEKV